MKDAYWILYETVNNVNGKIYVGVHKTNRNVDNYLGSGMVLRQAIKKHGRNNFTRRTLCVGDRDYIYHLEGLYVDETFVKRLDTYNVQIGGSYSPENGTVYVENDDQKHHRLRGIRDYKLSKDEIAKRVASRKANDNPEWHHTDEHKQFMSNMMKSLPEDHPAIKTQFKKGSVPHNKGKKMNHHNQGKLCVVNGVTYPSMRNAADTLGIPRRTMHNRILSDNFPDYNYNYK